MVKCQKKNYFSFSKTNDGVDPVAITRYNFGKNIRSIWNKEKEPDQWKALSDYIVAQNPDKIGINISEHYGIADGLAKTDYDLLIQSLPKSSKESNFSRNFSCSLD